MVKALARALVENLEAASERADYFELQLAELAKLRKQMELVEDRFDAFESLVEELNGLNEERSRVEGLLDETTQAFLKEVSSGEQAGGGGEKGFDPIESCSKIQVTEKM